MNFHIIKKDGVDYMTVILTPYQNISVYLIDTWNVFLIRDKEFINIYTDEKIPVEMTVTIQILRDSFKNKEFNDDNIKLYIQLYNHYLFETNTVEKRIMINHRVMYLDNIINHSKSERMIDKETILKIFNELKERKNK